MLWTSAGAWLARAKSKRQARRGLELAAGKTLEIFRKRPRADGVDVAYTHQQHAIAATGSESKVQIRIAARVATWA